MGEQLLKFAVNVLFNGFDVLGRSPGGASVAIHRDVVSGLGVYCLCRSDPHKNHPVKGRPTVHLAPAWIGAATP